MYRATRMFKREEELQLFTDNFPCKLLDINLRLFTQTTLSDTMVQSTLERRRHKVYKKFAKLAPKSCSDALIRHFEHAKRNLDENYPIKKSREPFGQHQYQAQPSRIILCVEHIKIHQPKNRSKKDRNKKE